MGDRLETYREKRDFGATPEPAGEAASREGEAPIFVVQEHHATALHWDFRLEHDGVLVSWAVPKGIPQDPKTNHLAVQTEDHPLEYADFEGEIPRDNYGAGKVTIWDRGTYELHKFRDKEVMVTLRGERVRGKYVLFRTDGRNWMIHRMDPPEDPDREPMPRHVAPMLATLAKLPRDSDRYAFEVKWDGVRAIAYVSGGRVRLESRRGNDITPQFPELRELGKTLGSHEVVLDGEIVAFDEAGRPSFETLQRRLGVGRESQVRRLAGQVPVVYMLFDLLYLNGHSTTALPYTARRELLEKLELAGEHWQTPRTYRGDARAVFEATTAQGLEGVVAKRLDSPYEPGQRSTAWLKVKNRRQQEFVVGGWTPRQGSGAATGFGALLIGYHDAGARGDRLRFAGRVGTGFTEAEMRRFRRKLDELRADENPFADGDVPADATFVEPRIVVEVEFVEWTRAGVLRAPAYKGERPDIDAADVVREREVEAP